MYILYIMRSGSTHDSVRNHRIVVGIGILGDVEILLDDAPRIGKKRPVCPDPRAKLVSLSDIVGANRDEATVANFHLAMQLKKAFMLSPVLWTKGAPAQNENRRVLSL